MTFAVRFSAALLLAGLALVSVSNNGFAQGEPWFFDTYVDPMTDNVHAFAGSTLSDGATIGFFCEKGNPVSEFIVQVKTREFDLLPAGITKVAWRIDNGPAHEEIWGTSPTAKGEGVMNFGESGYEFARAAAVAQDRIVFRNRNGIVIFGAKGSTISIAQLAEFCDLPR